MIIILLLLIIQDCKVSSEDARKLSQLNGDPFFISGNINIQHNNVTISQHKKEHYYQYHVFITKCIKDCFINAL